MNHVSEIKFILKELGKMSSLTFQQKPFFPSPPDKGSFPLDHDGECKKQMLKYLLCLNQKDNSNAECKSLSKDYLQCRMEKNLMAQEDWDKLGFSEKPENNDPKTKRM
ncbi:cytochrome c oxidase assembly protein COX19 [Caerostris darwini]|uniref:Cytochrome c oxidase assembly protein COX19 n=1 Tax=Caerostris darwini TaxID=1538125 RepID=A0AAV4X9B7_9ARAC|nr:cytochrome c oxidase assembly protein COX19 [Caerostris darwini]